MSVYEHTWSFLLLNYLQSGKLQYLVGVLYLLIACLKIKPLKMRAVLIVALFAVILIRRLYRRDETDQRPSLLNDDLHFALALLRPTSLGPGAYSSSCSSTATT